MLRAIRTTNGWVLCPKCGHKLAKLQGTILSTGTDAKRETSNDTEVKLEIKCTSCKEIVVIGKEVLR